MKVGTCLETFAEIQMLIHFYYLNKPMPMQLWSKRPSRFGWWWVIPFTIWKTFQQSVGPWWCLWNGEYKIHQLWSLRGWHMPISEMDAIWSFEISGNTPLELAIWKSLGVDRWFLLQLHMYQCHRMELREFRCRQMIPAVWLSTALFQPLQLLGQQDHHRHGQTLPTDSGTTAVKMDRKMMGLQPLWHHRPQFAMNAFWNSLTSPMNLSSLQFHVPQLQHLLPQQLFSPCMMVHCRLHQYQQPAANSICRCSWEPQMQETECNILIWVVMMTFW